MSRLKQIAGLISDTVSKVVRVDSSTHTMQTITYPHHEVHAGSAFFVRDVTDLAINNVLDIQITTPDTTKWAHFTFRFFSESETNWWLYENVTINTAGTAMTEFNHNRNSGTTATTAVAQITNTSIANANADTAIAGATELMHCISGSGRDGGEAEHSIELVLKQNEDYSLRFEASTAGFICWFLDWYEHTDKGA